MPSSSPRRRKLRDRVAHRVCNFVLRHVASREYRAFIGVTSRRGLEHLLAHGPEATVKTGASNIHTEIRWFDGR